MCEGQIAEPVYSQAKPRMFGDANHATDFFRNEFMMGAEHSVAIQAVHGATHTAHIGVKYTWFGSGYISNMFYKMIANKPTYRFQRGGDLRWARATFLSTVFILPSFGGTDF